MYKVVKFIPTKTRSATTTKSLFDTITETGSSEVDVKGGFLTEGEARNHINQLYKSNPLTEWQYSVKEE